VVKYRISCNGFELTLYILDFCKLLYKVKSHNKFKHYIFNPHVLVWYTKEFLEISFFCWQHDELVGFNEADVNPKRFDYQKLRTATKNFSKDRKLGAGAYGAVYKVFS
jgi:hypothetical protein